MDGSAACGGVPGVDGENGCGACAQDGGDDGEYAPLLFFCCDGLMFAGARGFSADVDDVGTFIKHAQGVSRGRCWTIEEAAVGKRIRGDVEDTHNECARTEGEGARAQLPLKLAAARKGH